MLLLVEEDELVMTSLDVSLSVVKRLSSMSELCSGPLDTMIVTTAA